MKYKYSDVLEGICTYKEYHNQFNPIQLELNNEYTQHKNKYNEKKFKIIFIDKDNKIAVGKVISNKIGKEFTGDFQLFYAKSGFKYQDNRIKEYQLTK